MALIRMSIKDSLSPSLDVVVLIDQSHTYFTRNTFAEFAATINQAWTSLFLTF